MPKRITSAMIRAEIAKYIGRAEGPNGPRCSFCGKSHAEVKQLIAGAFRTYLRRMRSFRAPRWSLIQNRLARVLGGARRFSQTMLTADARWTSFSLSRERRVTMRSNVERRTVD